MIYFVALLRRALEIGNQIENKEKEREKMGMVSLTEKGVAVRKILLS